MLSGQKAFHLSRKLLFQQVRESFEANALSRASHGLVKVLMEILSLTVRMLSWQGECFNSTSRSTAWLIIFA